MNDRFSRQALAFGTEGQRKLSQARVGVAGVGGIGLQVIQNLVYMGVRDFVLVDDDKVETSNLNRLVGATALDAQQETLKVDVAERLIRTIIPDAKLDKYPTNIRNEDAIDSLAGRDCIFGCVDNDAARLVLTELASAFEITFIDSAFEIKVDLGRVTEFGGRVVVAKPGEFCLLCADQIELNVAKIELESPPEGAFREKHGYGLGPQSPSPSVISLNAIIAGIATTEFLMVLTGIRPYNRMVTYKGMRGVATTRRDAKKPQCLVCNYLVGKRESADVKRYLCKDLPSDLLP